MFATTRQAQKHPRNKDQMQSGEKGKSSRHAVARSPQFGQPDNQACYPAEDEYERMREVLRIEQENKACANKAKQN
jgi:hypothetical protein